MLTLSLFKPRILLVNHIQFALASDNLAIGASFLYGCLNFHFLFVLETQAMRLYITYLYLNTILPFVKSYGDISNLTLSPGKMRM